jgi:hypothetical protein
MIRWLAQVCRSPWNVTGVRSRDEVAWVDLEDGRVGLPSIADGLEWCAPSQRPEVLGEIVGGDEGQDMGLERLGVGVVEGLDGGLFHRPVHPLRLAVIRHDGRGA